MLCLNCQIEFTPERATARFHNDSCRVQYSRKNKDRGGIPKGVPEETPIEIPEEVRVSTPFFVNDGESGIQHNGKFIPESELNVFYRGKKGKVHLAMDEVYAEMWKGTGKVLYTEKEKLGKINLPRKSLDK